MFLAQLVLVAVTPRGADPSVETVRPQVMILGTYHMANPGLDLVKTKIRDTMSPERQREIEEVEAALAKFRPTKITVESTDQEAVDRRLSAYLRGEAPLQASETEQIGFRLAKRSGLTKVYAIDTKLDLDFDRTFGFLQKHDPDRLEKVNGLIAKIGPLMEELDAKYSVGQILAIHNAEDSVRASHSFYTRLLSAGDGHEFPGADMLADWYKRNLRIAADLLRIVSPGDRVLTLYGSGHVKYLRDIIRDEGTADFVSPLRFLPKPPTTIKLPD